MGSIINVGSIEGLEAIFYPYYGAQRGLRINAASQLTMTRWRTCAVAPGRLILS